MHEPNQRIQFFNSESSFGSASNLPDSKYYDFTNQLIAETENIFAVLKRQLQPNERQSHQQKVEYSLRRAQILQKDTIPEHIAYLNRIQAPLSAKHEIANCKQRLGKLLGDYQKLKKGTMIYKQFYNIYGKESSNQNSAVSLKKENSSDPQQNEARIKQQSIQVSNISDKSRLKGVPRVFTKQDAENIQNDKEVSALKEQIINLRKTIEQNRKRHQLELTNQKLLFQKRIRTYLSLDLNGEERQRVLRSQIQQYSEKLSLSLQENIRLEQIIGKLNKDIRLIQYQNQINNKQNILLSKIEKIHNALNDLSKSHHQDKREEKIIRNIMEENQLLVCEIKNQRKRFYQIQSSLSEQQRRQCERNKKYLQKKKGQLQQLYANFDKQRIQIVQLSYSNRSHSQTLSELKKQNQQLKQVNSKPLITLNEYPPPSILSFSMKQKKAISKLVVQGYEGDGIQGFPYYQMLSKEFRIRFRRACLKQKQLIYKANNIEIGTITTFYTPNTIQILIHLTNCSEAKLSNLKIKVMNANENTIDGEYYEYSGLSANEQIKVPVSLTINQYPIGPLILLLQYHSQKKEQIRILLPAHIIKTMQIQQRFTDINLLSSSKVTIVSERKICKEINDIKQYFTITKITGQTIRLSVFHQHTRTQMELDLMQTKEGIDVMCNYIEGMREISDYFIKTFLFLIRKEQIK